MKVAGVLVITLVSRFATAQPVGARIDAIMKPWAKRDSPGCAVAVVQRAKVTFAKGYGMADLERAVPITPDTVFDIGSVSKQITAATILLLAADGKLALDDDIRKHLPELAVTSKQPVTIRHLLHHTGGLRDYTTLLGLVGTSIPDVATAAETLALLARQRGADFEPGTKHEYSNTGYFLLAQIAERVGKQPMARLVGERIFKPLGMKRSTVLDSSVRIVPGRAIGYRPATTSGWQLDMSQWEQTGDGAVLTTVRDLALWDGNLTTGKVGGKPLVEAIHRKGKLRDGSELPYAAGVVHGTYRGLATVSHGGGWAGYRAFLMRFPTHATSIVVACNAGTARPNIYANQIADVVLAKQLKPADKPAAPTAPATAVKLTTAELDAWVGTYRDAKKGSVFAITRDGDRLVAGDSGEQLILEPISKTRANLKGTPLVIELSGTAPKRSLRAQATGFDETFVEAMPYKATAAELAAFAGTYRSGELGVTWTIALEKGALILVDRGHDLPITVLGKDEISVAAHGLSMKMVRSGKVVTLLASTGAVRDLRFERL